MSWIIVRRSDALPILETYSGKVAAKINRRAYAVIPVARWLGALNRALAWGSDSPERDALQLAEGAAA